MPRKKNKRKERQAAKLTSQPKPKRTYAIAHSTDLHLPIALIAMAILKKGPDHD